MRNSVSFAATVCCLVCLVVGGAAAAAAERVYTMGVVPQFEPRKLTKIWAPIIEELEKRSGVDIMMVGSPRIPEFEVAFMNGEFDFAYMNPYHSLMAAKTQDYVPLVRDGSRELFGVLVVEKDSPYQSVEDLNGKSVAFPAPNALGASLMMRADLTRKYGLTFKSSFVATHSSAYLNVALGEADAAGGVMSTFNRVDPRVKDRLRILHETDRVPPHPVTAHPRVPKDVQERVKRAFIELGATEEGRALLSKVPMREVIEARQSDYEPLENLGLDEFVIRAGTEE